MSSLIPSPPSTVASPVPSPGSKPDSLPVVKPSSDIVDDIEKSQEKPKPFTFLGLPVSFGENPPTKPAPTKNSVVGQATTDPSQGQCKDAIQPTKPAFIKFNSTQAPLEPPLQDANALSHLEAYIVRPYCQDSILRVGLTWSYTVAYLPVDNEAIQAHIRKLGDDQSIIDDIWELDPEQLHVIKLHAKYRKGVLVSAQLGKPIDIVTKMGTFLTKGVVFIIRTSRAIGEDDYDAVEYERDGSKKLSPVFGTPAKKMPSGGSGGNPATATGFGSATAAPAPATKVCGGNSVLTSSAEPFVSNEPTFDRTDLAPASDFGVRAKRPKSTSDSGTSKTNLAAPATKASVPKTTTIPSRFAELARFPSNGDFIKDRQKLKRFHEIAPLPKKKTSIEELSRLETEVGGVGPCKGAGWVHPLDCEKQRAASGVFGQAISTSSGELSEISTKDTAESGVLFGDAKGKGATEIVSGSSTQATSVSSGDSSFGPAQALTTSSEGLLETPTKIITTSGFLFGGAKGRGVTEEPFRGSTEATSGPSGSGLFGSCQSSPSGSAVSTALPSFTRASSFSFRFGQPLSFGRVSVTAAPSSMQNSLLGPDQSSPSGGLLSTIPPSSTSSGLSEGALAHSPFQTPQLPLSTSGSDSFGSSGSIFRSTEMQDEPTRSSNPSRTEVTRNCPIQSSKSSAAKVFNESVSLLPEA
jgi:hypothetical protein